MSSLSYNPLQISIYQLLDGDVTLGGLVDAIYDRPPQGSPFPYVTIGEGEAKNWSTNTTSGTEEEIIVDIWSREGGRKTTASVMEQVHTLLHDASLVVSGYELIMMRFVNSNITLENDGWTYRGRMRFQAFLQAS